MKKKNRMSSVIIISIITILLFNTFIATPVSAQKMQAGINIMVADMQGEFKKNVGNLGWGVSANFGYRLENSPVILGGTIGFIEYGSERRREPFSTTIPEVEVEVINSNNIVLFEFFFSLEPAAGSVRPYVGAQMGFSYLYTSTRIEEVTGLDEIASDTNFDDLAFNMGAFGGLKFRVWENDENFSEGERGVGGVFIDLRLDYLYGSKAEYLKEGSIFRGTENRVVYDVNRSNTSMMLYKIGVGVEF